MNNIFAHQWCNPVCGHNHHCGHQHCGGDHRCCTNHHHHAGRHGCSHHCNPCNRNTMCFCGCRTIGCLPEFTGDLKNDTMFAIWHDCETYKYSIFNFIQWLLENGLGDAMGNFGDMKKSEYAVTSRPGWVDNAENAGKLDGHTYQNIVDLINMSKFSGVHNDLSGRSASDCHPWSAISNKPFESLGSGLSVSGGVLSVTVTGGATVHNDLTGRSAADCHPWTSIGGKPFTNIGSGLTVVGDTLTATATSPDLTPYVIGNVGSSPAIKNVVAITLANFNALGVKDPNTVYFVKD